MVEPVLRVPHQGDSGWGATFADVAPRFEAVSRATDIVLRKPIMMLLLLMVLLLHLAFKRWFVSSFIGAAIKG